MKKKISIACCAVFLILVWSFTCYFLWHKSETSLMELENKEIVYHRVDNSYTQFLMNDFNKVEDVYKNIKSGDRIIFLVRHSERMYDCSSKWWLSDQGIELAKWVWEKLKWMPFEDTSNDFYWSSIVKRTIETSYYVGESRGSKVLEYKLEPDLWLEYPCVNHPDDLDIVLHGDYFIGDYPYREIYSYYEENKDEINSKALDLINFLCKMTEWHPFSWITSHDTVSFLLTEWSTDETLSFNSDEWTNFMEWIAIIIHPDGGWEVYPVKSLSEGKIPIRADPDCW